MESNFTQQIRDKARELLENGTVECVIGYETGSDGSGARPAFVYEAADAERMVFDNTCTHSLVKYLLNKKNQSVAIVVKGCDSRALNLLLVEKQIERDKVLVIGVVCPRVVEWGWNKRSDKIDDRCNQCRQHTPLVYDFLVGEPVDEEPLPADYFAEVTGMEEKQADERLAFWKEQTEHCIRCYACRNVCPGCYCTDCFVELLDPEWVGIRIADKENLMWNTIRAFHLAGRCIACNECERVCPANIPLSLLNRKLEQEVLNLFDFRSGMSAEVPAPLITFKKDEKLEE
ncbi:4Fe-4S dicluster domain-containing protein [Chloroflexota bacterium]